MTQQQPQPIYLSDYQPPKFQIDHAHLYFDIRAEHVWVTAVLNVQRQQNAEASEPLVLDGDHLELHTLRMNGETLSEEAYHQDEQSLTIFQVGDQFNLETQVKLTPSTNTQLMGLYESSGNLCTQCEPHGFRRITYFIDRPDVLCRFTTAIAGDAQRFPYLLSNGNLIDQQTLADGRQWVKWEDPSYKPCYLFALVAGDFDQRHEQFTTMNGRTIDLYLYTEKGYGHQGDHALSSLKHAMKWDEQQFGREYDLDCYMMVAVSDFNMGAMENKGLNIFNTQFVLVTPETATDQNYTAAEEVIGHEYFHNWSGNRVTLRNWFQLSLKEGLTIFRDQWFTADMTSKAVKRIDDANIIKTAQFAEDDGPTAHPVRPQSYIEINNFYTLTVYHKGAEVIRMLYYLLGAQAFRRAMDLYFERHDGQAVTTDDFVQAMEDAGHLDLTQFRRWYDQAGTPRLTINTIYDDNNHTYELTVTQHCPPTPDQFDKKPLMIPLAIGLVGSDGNDLPLQLEHEHEPSEQTTRVLIANDWQQHFRFINVEHKPVPSILRHFSAPARYHYDYDDAELAFLYQYDNDDYNRWDAGQQLMTRHIKNLMMEYERNQSFTYPETVISAMRTVLNHPNLDRSLKARSLSLPSITFLTQQIDNVDMDALLAAHDFMHQVIAEELYTDLYSQYQSLHESGDYIYSSEHVGQRELKNVCLRYLMVIATYSEKQIAFNQFVEARHMTDQMAALTALNHVDCVERERALQQFYEQWRHDPLVLDKWFSVQASSKLPSTLKRVRELMQHPDFDARNPNKIRALIAVFAKRNPWHFHARNGSGYDFLKDQVIRVDQFNPQIASRLVEPLTQWHQYDQMRQKLMYQALQTISQQKQLSNDLYEIVNKSLNFSKSDEETVRG